MTIDKIKNNIQNYSLDEISHFWKLSKLYMEKVKNDSEEIKQLQRFQSFLEKQIKKIRKLKIQQL